MNKYLISIISGQTFNDKNMLKLYHAIITHVFEKCAAWKKGQAYPNFKIDRLDLQSIKINTDIDLQIKTFSILYGGGLNEVSVAKIADAEEATMFLDGDIVDIGGTISLYKNTTNRAGKRIKKAYVRFSKQENKNTHIEDENEFKDVLRKKLGVEPENIFASPIYVDQRLVPGDKQINTAISLRVIGKVIDKDLVNSLNYKSIGSDIGYGFGSLDVAMAQREQ